MAPPMRFPASEQGKCLRPLSLATNGLLTRTDCLYDRIGGIASLVTDGWPLTVGPRLAQNELIA
jgi:hypothetical protein